MGATVIGPHWHHAVGISQLGRLFLQVTFYFKENFEMKKKNVTLANTSLFMCFRRNKNLL